MKLLLCQKHPFLTRDRQHSDMFLEGRNWGWGGAEGPTGGNLENEKEIVADFYPCSGIQSRYQCTKSCMETLQETHLFNLV